MDDPAAFPDGASVDAVFAATYRELRRLAHARLRGGGRDVLLDTTALVHESYLKLARASGLQFSDRPRFLVYAGRVMRSIIVDWLRQRRSERHGGDCGHLTLTGAVADEASVPRHEAHILRVHEALQAMAEVDARMAQVVEMRYFAGLNDDEIGEALGITGRTVRRDWEQARVFLAAAMK